MIDYRISFASANGKPRQRVFKLKQMKLYKEKSIVIKKKHPLRADMTTFKIYPGKHTLTLQVNGNDFENKGFEILA